jgi:hypothetical protein
VALPELRGAQDGVAVVGAGAMITWVLHVCIGATWAGCGAFVMYEYPSEQQCQASLRAAVIQSQRVTMWCAPKQEDKRK